METGLLAHGVNDSIVIRDLAVQNDLGLWPASNRSTRARFTIQQSVISKTGVISMGKVTTVATPQGALSPEIIRGTFTRNVLAGFFNSVMSEEDGRPLGNSRILLSGRVRWQTHVDDGEPVFAVREVHSMNWRTVGGTQSPILFFMDVTNSALEVEVILNNNNNINVCLTFI